MQAILPCLHLSARAPPPVPVRPAEEGLPARAVARMPLAPDTYEFRFLANNGYTLLATSVPVVVVSGTN